MPLLGSASSSAMRSSMGAYCGESQEIHLTPVSGCTREKAGSGGRKRWCRRRRCGRRWGGAASWAPESKRLRPCSGAHQGAHAGAAALPAALEAAPLVAALRDVPGDARPQLREYSLTWQQDARRAHESMRMRMRILGAAFLLRCWVHPHPPPASEPPAQAPRHLEHALQRQLEVIHECRLDCGAEGAGDQHC